MHRKSDVFFFLFMSLTEGAWLQQNHMCLSLKRQREEKNLSITLFSLSKHHYSDKHQESNNMKYDLVLFSPCYLPRKVLLPAADKDSHYGIYLHKKDLFTLKRFIYIKKPPFVIICIQLTYSCINKQYISIYFKAVPDLNKPN